MRLRIEPLSDEHNRAAFSCGHDLVDGFLHRYARQRRERNIGTTLVAVDADNGSSRIVGFYTLLPHEFRGAELADSQRRATRVGQLSAIPGALLAQLGVDVSVQGQGIGVVLVRHALARALYLAEEFGCVAVVTDPIDDRARRLYTGFGFTPLVGNPSRLILSVKAIAEATRLSLEREAGG